MKDWLRHVNKVLEGIENFMAYLAGILLFIMVLSICYEIVLRYFFSRPTLWVVGLVEYILFCATFLGTGWLLRKDGHVKVDIGMAFFSEKGRALLNAITSCIGIASCIVMTLYGTKTTYDFFVRNIMTSQDPEIPKFLLLAFIPLGFFFLVIEFIRRGFESLITFKNLGAH